jgi:hypothetical protein
MCVCWGEGQAVSECPLESPPVEGERPVAVRPFLSLRRKPHFRTRKSFVKNKNMATGLKVPETKTDCAGEDHQQFTRPHQSLNG